MADLEKIVRPFQIKPNASALPEKVLEARKSAIPVTHRFGEHGKGKTTSASFSSQTTFFHSDKVQELSRPVQE